MPTASAQDAVQALVRPVLPRTTRVHTVRIARRLAPPGRHALCAACSTLIPVDLPRRAMGRPPPPPPVDDRRRGERAGTVDLPARSRVCSQDGEALQPSSLGGRVMDPV